MLIVCGDKDEKIEQDTLTEGQEVWSGKAFDKGTFEQRPEKDP